MLTQLSTDGVILCGLQKIPANVVFFHVVHAGVPLEAVTRKALILKTACCRAVSLQSFPSVIFADLTKYATSMSTANVFTFAVEGVPAKAITVTPFMSITSILSLPTSFNFLDSSSPSMLQGSCNHTLVVLYAQPYSYLFFSQRFCFFSFLY